MSEENKDTFATRMSKQIDKMMRERALKSQQEREAKQAQQQQEQAQKTAQAPQAQPEGRSTIDQISQDRQATERGLREAGAD